MRGLDGNYLNAQGDATARMQVAYQAEMNRQQLKAQLEGVESLRKLREQVNGAEKENSSEGPRLVTEDQGSESQADQPEDSSGGQKTAGGKTVLDDDRENVEKAVKSHIDIRV